MKKAKVSFKPKQKNWLFFIFILNDLIPEENILNYILK